MNLFQKKNYTDLKYGILIDDGRTISNRRRNQLNKLQNGANMIYGMAQKFGILK